VLPGVWRLRLPLPWPGVPHCNAWALAAGDGIVLVDTGMHEPGSLGHLERALDQVGLRLEHVRLLVCTHAHSDHCGQAAAVIERSGCELWMHPAYEHARFAHQDPEAALERRLEVALQSGVPEAPLRAFAAQRRDRGTGIDRLVPPDRDLVPGVEIETDLGPWSVHETPGHAPSHVCLFQAERRLLVSGDHVLGRVSLWFDAGDSADPVGDYVRSLDVVDRLDARLCLPGHGRTFGDVHGHIEANRTAVAAGLDRVREVISADGPLTAFDAVGQIHGVPTTPMAGSWLLGETLAFLRHLEAEGRARRIEGEPERWAATTLS
jgi:glyoxylase-like metal-dependent hydrolase (beta-lactamase superfamily II)